METLDLKKILLKIRKYEIRIRKAVNARMRGNFSSVFKGSGLEFDDIRTYQYGDDVRRIDWNSSAKGEDTYIKVFKEEKEQTVFFLADVSKSNDTHGRANLMREICSVLAFSAIREGSEAGLLCYSDQKEKYIKPDKGMKKAYEIALNFYKLVPQSNKTDLSGFIKFFLNMFRRRGIIFFISDFIDNNYEEAITPLAKKHDLIILHLTAKAELAMPKLGLIPIQDQETGTIRWINSSAKQEQEMIKNIFEERVSKLEYISKLYQTDYVQIDAEEDFVPKLVKLFKVRNQRIRNF